jgi:hypothetical protein
VSHWGVASGGCNPEVKELPLKGTGEARGKPPRRRAWLRDRMVSATEAGFNLWETGPLPRYILHTWPQKPGLRGSDRIQWFARFQRMTEAG